MNFSIGIFNSIERSRTTAMVSTESGDVLSNDQVEKFKREGYLFISEFFDDDQIKQFKNEANRILELVVNTSLANNRMNRRLALNSHGDGSQSIRNVQPFIDLSLPFKRVAVNDLPPLLKPLIDDEPISLDRTSQLNYKQPLPKPITELDGDQFSGGYPIHADWPYFEGKVPAPTNLIIASVFIDACTPDNGSMEIWPGTHKEDLEHKDTELGAFAVPQDRIDYDAGMMVHGPPGSILLFNAKLAHSSVPNETDGPRRLAIYRHAPKSDVDTQIIDGSARPRGYGYPRAINESPYENEYRRLKQQGEYEDKFVSPIV